MGRYRPCCQSRLAITVRCRRGQRGVRADAARPDTRLLQGDLGQLAAGAINRFLGDEQDVRLFREMNDDGTVFGSGAGLVRSAALVRMRPSKNLPAGLLALGAREATFHPGQGAELLTFLCRVLEQSIVRALDGDSEPQAAFGD